MTRHEAAYELLRDQFAKKFDGTIGESAGAIAEFAVDILTARYDLDERSTPPPDRLGELVVMASMVKRDPDQFGIDLDEAGEYLARALADDGYVIVRDDLAAPNVTGTTVQFGDIDIYATSFAPESAERIAAQIREWTSKYGPGQVVKQVKPEADTAEELPATDGFWFAAGDMSLPDVVIWHYVPAGIILTAACGMNATRPDGYAKPDLPTDAVACVPCLNAYVAAGPHNGYAAKIIARNAKAGE